MRAADIHMGHDYRIAHMTHQYARGRVVEQPSEGKVRIQIVDPGTGQPLDPAQVRTRQTRDLLCPWEEYAGTWATREAHRVLAKSAVDALDAALSQRGITPRMGPHPSEATIRAPYVRLALNATDAVELAGWLAGMPETVRVVE